MGIFYCIALNLQEIKCFPHGAMVLKTVTYMLCIGKALIAFQPDLSHGSEVETCHNVSGVEQ